jgi:hypothetical protein
MVSVFSCVFLAKVFFNMKKQWIWWHIPVILALGRLRQEQLEFEAILGHLPRT